MITITNGMQTFKVSKGAYQNTFKNMGFSVVENNVENVEKPKSNNDGEKSEDEKFIERMMEKPIANWSKEELLRFAELKEIDISGTESPREAKEIIKKIIY